MITEKYFNSNGGYYKDRLPRAYEPDRYKISINKDEYNKQKSRFIAKCSLYMVNDETYMRGYDSHTQTIVGIDGTRRAVVEAKGHDEWSGDRRDHYTDSYFYGELSVLCIAKA